MVAFPVIELYNMDLNKLGGAKASFSLDLIHVLSDNLDITVILFQYGQTTHCFDFQQVQEHIRRTFDLSYVMLFIIWEEVFGAELNNIIPPCIIDLLPATGSCTGFSSSLIMVYIFLLLNVCTGLIRTNLENSVNTFTIDDDEKITVIDFPQMITNVKV
ncbi:hypothetical protein ACJX0J_013251, partial [Zea mays]